MNRPATVGNKPEIRITLHDLNRIEALLTKLEAKRALRAVEFLRAEVDRAILVDNPAATGAFVGIGSTVVFRDDTGRVHRGTLALPGQSLERPDALSVMSGIGTALLGLSPGQTMTYGTPDGRIRSITVLALDTSRGAERAGGPG